MLKFLQQQEREQDWIELKADEEAKYDLYDAINLSELEPMIACPSSPGNVVKVRDFGMMIRVTSGSMLLCLAETQDMSGVGPGWATTCTPGFGITRLPRTCSHYG